MVDRTAGLKDLEDSNIHTYLRDKLGVTKYRDTYYRRVECRVFKGHSIYVVGS